MFLLALCKMNLLDAVPMSRALTLLRSGSSLATIAASVVILLAGSQAKAQSLAYVPVITTFAGGAAAVCSTATNKIGDGCLATQATLNLPWNSTSDAAGNMYIADSGNNVVRRVDAATGIITTVAGGASSLCAATTDTVGDGCPATQATLGGPAWVRFDPSGNLVIADRANHRVRLVDRTTGNIRTIVGTGATGSTVASNAKPKGSAATACSNPTGLVFDRAGNLYVTCSARYYVALIVAVNGVIDGVNSLMYDLAGTGVSGYSGDGGVAASAEISGAQGLSIDAAGNLFIGDYQNYDVRKVTSPFQSGVLNLNKAIISTYAGTPAVAGYTGDGGAATSAEIGNGRDANIDNAGRVYITSYQISGSTAGDQIRVVDPCSGIISTVTGNGTRATTGDGGPAVLGAINGPYATSFDRSGSAFIDAYVGNDIRRVSQNNTFFGNAVASAGLSQNIIAQASSSITLASIGVTPVTNNAADFAMGAPSGCASASALAASAYCTLPVSFAPVLPGIRTARLMINDGARNNSIGLSGVGYAPLPGFSGSPVTTVAGTGVAGSDGNAGAANGAQINAPRGGAVDAQGNIYFADSLNNAIRKVSASGIISTVAGGGSRGYTGDGGLATTATLSGPAKVALDSAGDLYIADTGNNAIRFVNVDTGVISTVAGTGTAAYTGDAGNALSAALSHPQGVAVDAGGNVYVADTGNNVIRHFVVGGIMSTVAGAGMAGFSGDGGAPALAQLNAPSSVSLDSNGNLYIADTGNGVIRILSNTGYIGTVAGVAGGAANSGDGGPAISASLLSPTDVAADAGGDLYIAAGNEVRTVNAAGIISTFAGTSAAGSYSGEGGASTAAALGASAQNLFVDGSFNVYIAATSSNRLLKVSSASAPTLTLGAVTPGTISSAQSMTVTNTGNRNLVLSGLAVSAKFNLQTSATGACTSSTIIAPGASCTLSVTFSPDATAKGAATGTITLTDNALNASAATQIIPLTGTAFVVAATTTSVSISPASFVYGATGMATAIVSAGTAPGGNVTFAANGVSLGAVAVVSGKASISLPILPAGQTTITASYAGDTANGSSNGSAAVTVQPAMLTVTAADASFVQGATVPSLTYSMKGFVNGETASIVSGTPAESTTAVSGSSPGSYTITISAGTLSAANYNFTFVNGTLSVQTPPPPDFSLTASPSSFSLAAGQTATTTVSLASMYNHTGSVQLSCTGLPINASCTFLTTTLKGDPTANAKTTSTTLFISTDNYQRVSSLYPNRKVLAASVWPLLLLLGLPGLRRRQAYTSRILLALLCSVFALGIGGCGSTDVSTAKSGTYTITVTAADSGSQLNHAATIALNLQ